MWLNVLEAKVQYGNDRICFLAYDDEHHRLALANLTDGYKPHGQIHHGPTLSLYYRDPDGNQAEMQVAVYDTVDEANEFMFGPEFAANPIGLEVHMEDLIARRNAGEPDSELIKRPKTAAST